MKDIIIRNVYKEDIPRFVIDEFKSKNKTKMILWCLKENEPSKKFYTKMGGEIIKERMIEIGEKNY